MLGAVCLAAVVITPWPAAGQVQIQLLDRTEASFPEPFTSVSGLRELSDGRILIADRTEKHVSLIDFASGSIREIGRVGGGPGEYQSPGDLVALPNDCTLLLDLANPRLTRIAPDGRLEMESWPMMIPTRLVRPSAADAQGRLFYSASGGMRMARGGGAASTPPDSLPIMRWDPATNVTDTVGMIYSPSPVSLGGGNVSLSTGRSGRISLAGFRQRPFSPRDAWAAMPDGGGAGDDISDGLVPNRSIHCRSDDRLRPDSYQPGRERSLAEGPANQHGMLVAMGGSGRAGGRTLEMPRPDLDEVEFPDYKPPFPISGVHATPDAQIWVQRYQRHDEERALFDIFGDRSELVKQVRLPAGRRVWRRCAVRSDD